ncbi:MAG: putative metal-dependent hydrolase, TIM-barrel fold [Chloroflexi bacterium]|nr:MAG: putative metal-dependent hydrolase, TIM-barrel fold [Chloroflexota bacterium]
MIYAARRTKEVSFMGGVVDADTHIIEHEGIWEFMDKDLYSKRPVLLAGPSDTLYKGANGFWLIDGSIVPKPAGKGSVAMANPASDNEKARIDIDQDVRELTNPVARIRDMDARDVDIEVIFSTLFITYLTDDAELEVALCRAYNRYMAHACKDSGGRLQWVAVLPLRSIEDSVLEMNVAKEKGAAGVLFRGVEGDRSLAEAYFFPVYAEASRLNLPICVHTGAGSPGLSQVFDRTISHNLPHVRSLPLFAFRDLVAHKIPERFPDLRIGFIEAAASWIPYVVHHLRRAAKAPAQWLGGGGTPEDDEWGPKMFRDNRLFVALESDEDIPYLLNFIGEDNVIIGSDYGHQDQSRDVGVVATLKAREDISAVAKEKILSTNPRRFYGLN